MLAVHSPVLSRARNTMRRMFPPVSQLFYDSLAQSRKFDAVFHRFVALDGNFTLSKEGFRQQFLHGRFTLDSLPMLSEAMQLEGLDPTIPIAALEAACLPRDPEIDGNLADDLSSIAIEIGTLAQTIRDHGSQVSTMTKTQILEIAQIAGRVVAQGRRLNQEALDGLTQIAQG